MNTNLTNKEKADTFLQICCGDEMIKQHMIYKVVKRHQSYLTSDFDDFYNDTLVLCYNTILKKGGEFPYPSNYKGYFYEALKNNYQEHQKRDMKKQKMFRSLNADPSTHLSMYEYNVPSVYPEILGTDDFLTQEEELTERLAEETTEEQDKKRMLDLVYKLDEHLREPLLLHYFNKQSYKQISKALGISFHMTRNRLYVARQELKKQMEKH